MVRDRFRRALAACMALALWRIARSTLCPEADKRRNGETQFLKSVREEMAGLAVSRKDRDLLRRVDGIIEMSRDAAESR